MSNLIGDEQLAIDEGEEADKPKDEPKDESDEDSTASAAAPEKEDEKGSEQPSEKDDEEPLKIEQPFVPPVVAAEDTDFEAARSRLLDERKELRASLRNGDIDQDEFDEKLDLINDKLQEVAVKRERAESSVAQSQAVAAAQYQWTLAQVKRHIASTEGIDYDAPENRGLLFAWDSKIKALASNEANADKPAEWFLSEAHKQVRAEVEGLAAKLGFKQAPKADAVKEALAKRKPDASKVKSLANLPSAEAASTSKDGDFTHLDGLAGLELEAELARLPKDQADAYLSGR